MTTHKRFDGSTYEIADTFTVPASTVKPTSTYFTGDYAGYNKDADMVGWKPNAINPYDKDKEQYYFDTFRDLNAVYSGMIEAQKLKAKNPEVPDAILTHAAIEYNNIKAGILQKKDAISLPLVNMGFDWEKNGPLLAGGGVAALVIYLIMKKKHKAA